MILHHIPTTLDTLRGVQHGVEDVITSGIVIPTIKVVILTYYKHEQGGLSITTMRFGDVVQSSMSVGDQGFVDRPVVP